MAIAEIHCDGRGKRKIRGNVMGMLTRYEERKGFPLGTLVLVALAVWGGISVFPDVVRYVRIKTM